ncbi:3515_t:CDS:2 [Entrophospora sp. SA101]|nr:4157_t:CDS:2 [Entrophospora sp. SA101]CAJ0646247.1 3515_t:CDS:2 [Entrophospora sp. SA101]CAJ0837204.1 361_t:CDS:2 [Entrophospora sp. SA101]
MSSGVRGHEAVSKYYIDCLEKWFQSDVCGFLNTILNIQDKNDDTALCIAARVGNNELAEKLVMMGANADIQNKLGLKPSDFVFSQQDGDDESIEDSKEDMDVDMIQENVSDFFIQPFTSFVNNHRKSREVVLALQKLVEDAENEWVVQLRVKEDELFNAQKEYLKFLKQVINEVEEDNNVDVYSMHRKCRVNLEDNASLLRKPNNIAPLSQVLSPESTTTTITNN